MSLQTRLRKVILGLVGSGAIFAVIFSLIRGYLTIREHYDAHSIYAGYFNEGDLDRNVATLAAIDSNLSIIANVLLMLLVVLLALFALAVVWVFSQEEL